MRSLGLVLVVLLATLAGGCGGDDDGNGGNTTGAKPPATASESSPTGTSNGPDSARPNAREGEDPTEKTNGRKTRSRNRKTRSGGKPSGRQGGTPGSRRVERYLRDNFGGGGDLPKASWYDRVVEVVVSGPTTVLRTDLSDNLAGKRVARQICMAVRGSIPGLTDTVEVTGLAGASNLARCVP